MTEPDPPPSDPIESVRRVEPSSDPAPAPQPRLPCAEDHPTVVTNVAPALVRWLTRTSPAALFLTALGLLCVAAVLSFLLTLLQVPPRAFFGPVRLLATDTSPPEFYPSSSPPIWRTVLAYTLNPTIFVASITGTALPIWAAARLIADALRDHR
jgi:hypothetical protein